MKNFLTVLLLLITILTYAQVSDSTAVKTDTIEINETPEIIYYKGEPDNKRSKRKDIRTLSGNMSHSGGFGALSFRSTDFRNETMVFAGLRGGWIINRTLAIGLEGHGIIPTAKYGDISAVQGEDVVPLGGYGGMFLELIFFSNEVVHVTFPVSGGAGWMGYFRDFENNNPSSSGSDLIEDDIFWYVEPGAGLEVNLSRSFRLAMGISKRFTQDLELTNTESSDFENLNYFITLKIGSF